MPEPEPQIPIDADELRPLKPKAQFRNRISGRVNARLFGYDADDSTEFLQAAMDASSTSVKVPYVSTGPWKTDPLTMRSNCRLKVHRGARIQAKDGYAADGNVLNGDAITRCGIVGSQGESVIEMLSEVLSVDGDGPHCVRFHGCTHGLIDGLTLRNSSGDGLYFGLNPVPCEDWLVKNLLVDTARRNGISITSGRRIHIRNTTIRNVGNGAGGASPKAGIDVEPNQASDPLTDLVFTNVLVEDVNQASFLVALNRCEATTEDVSILFDRCTGIGGNFGCRPHFDDPDDVGPIGLVEFRDCSFQDTIWQGIWCDWDVRVAINLRFTRCTLSNVGTASGKIPIVIDINNVPATFQASTGGIHFDDCIIYDNRNRDPIAFNLTDVADPDTRVTGNITVYNNQIAAGIFDAGITGLTVRVVHP